MKKKGCACFSWGCGTVALLIVAGIVIFIVTAPPFPGIPKQVLPNPNGYDDILAATQMLAKTGGDKGLYDANGIYKVGAEEAVLKANSGAISRLNEGLGKSCVMPQTDDVNMSFDYSSGTRSFARIFDAQTRLYIRQLRHAKAAETVLVNCLLGAKSRKGGALISTLVGIAIQAIATNKLDEIYDRLTAKECTHFADKLDEIARQVPSQAEVFENERIFALIYHQSGKFSNTLAPNAGGVGLKDNVIQRWDQVREVMMGSRYISEYNHDMLLLIEQVKLPIPKRHFAPPSGLLSEITLPVFGTTYNTMAVDSARIRLWSIAFRLRAFQLQNGKLPGTLIELGIPSDILTDPFSDQPFKYVPQGKTFLLYSVGPDGKDDGGAPADGSKGAMVGDIGVRHFRKLQPGVANNSRSKPVPFMKTP